MLWESIWKKGQINQETYTLKARKLRMVLLLLMLLCLLILIKEIVDKAISELINKVEAEVYKLVMRSTRDIAVWWILRMVST